MLENYEIVGPDDICKNLKKFSSCNVIQQIKKSGLTSSFVISVLANTVNTSAIPPLEIQILLPFKRNVLPSSDSVALVWMDAASLPLQKYRHNSWFLRCLTILQYFFNVLFLNIVKLKITDQSIGKKLLKIKYQKEIVYNFLNFPVFCKKNSLIFPIYSKFPDFSLTGNCSTIFPVSVGTPQLNPNVSFSFAVMRVDVSGHLKMIGCHFRKTMTTMLSSENFCIANFIMTGIQLIS